MNPMPPDVHQTSKNILEKFRLKSILQLEKQKYDPNVESRLNFHRFDGAKRLFVRSSTEYTSLWRIKQSLLAI